MSKTADALNGSQQYMNSIIAKSRAILGSSVYGVPIVTYGLIGLTSVILAYVTLVENSESTASMIPAMPTNIMAQMPANPFAQNSIPESNYSPIAEQLPTRAEGGSKTKHKHKKTKSKTKNNRK